MSDHPFGDLIGLQWTEVESPGESECFLDVRPELLNPFGVAHGGVLYSLADTGMGRAIARSLGPGEICATVDIRIAYHKGVRHGRVVCQTHVLSQGKRVAHLESRVLQDGDLVASATGCFSIFSPGNG